MIGHMQVGRAAHVSRIARANPLNPYDDIGTDPGVWCRPPGMRVPFIACSKPGLLSGMSAAMALTAISIPATSKTYFNMRHSGSDRHAATGKTPGGVARVCILATDRSIGKPAQRVAGMRMNCQGHAAYPSFAPTHGIWFPLREIPPS